MAKPKKAKRDGRIVMYVRLPPQEYAQIAAIVKQRGYPHTLTSVSTELILRALASGFDKAAAPTSGQVPREDEDDRDGSVDGAGIPQ